MCLNEFIFTFNNTVTVIIVNWKLYYKTWCSCKNLYPFHASCSRTGKSLITFIIPFEHHSKKSASLHKNHPIKILAYIYRTVQYKSHKTLFHFDRLNYVSLVRFSVLYYKPVSIETESGILIEKSVRQ